MTAWSRAALRRRRRWSTTPRGSTSSTSRGRSTSRAATSFSTRLTRRHAALGLHARRRPARSSRRSGPRTAPPADRRRFFTPFDLMVYGFGPIVPVYAAARARRGAPRATAATGRSSASRARRRCSARRSRQDAGRPLHAPSTVRSTLHQAGFRVRQRHAHELVRARQGPGEAGLPPPRRQRLDRRAGPLARDAAGRSWERCWSAPASRRAAAGAGPTRAGGSPTTSTGRTPSSASTGRSSRPPTRPTSPSPRASSARAPRSCGSPPPQRAIVEARRRLAGIQPPSEAATLRTRLLRYLDMNAAFARQTTWLARYQRRSPAVLGPLNAANARLRTRLQSATTAEQAAAMGDFAAALRRALRGMGALSRPRHPASRARGAGPPAAADPLAGPAAALRAAGPGRPGRRAPAPALPRQRRVDHLARASPCARSTPTTADSTS